MKSRSRISLSPVAFYLGFVALLATNALTLVGFLMSPDISRLFAGQNDALLVAYEDRISQLRIEVDRLQSRNYAQAGDINLQLQDLAQTQELLLEQHQYVKQLAGKAAELGIAGVAPVTPAEEAVKVSAISSSGADAATELSDTADLLTRMFDESRVVLTALSGEANTRTEVIVDALRAVDIRPTLPGRDAVGGPLLPAIDGPEESSLIDDANGVAISLERYRVARDAARIAPIHMPISDFVRNSSGFGNRKDPFTGRLAFHSGLDWAATQGTKVYSAGAGVVSFVGQKNGYGNVVEVTHADGLITRYAHLSAFIAQQGQKVSALTPIARVGSTGRSTGPHLHFEVLRGKSQLDPARYIKAGKELARILAG